MKVFKDISGTKFNRLTPISRSNKIHTKGDTSAMWNCICDCGVVTVVSSRSLKAGRIKSCGCLRIELNRKQAKNRRKEGISAPLARMIRSYKWNAEKRGLEFLLSSKEFLFIILQNCHYCKTKPQQFLKTIRNDDKENILVYNGIDRKNNDKGYNIENCVPCCGQCNRMKSSMNYSEFIAKIKAIAINFSDL